MRAATLVRVLMVVMFLASIGVAGTTVVLKTAATLLAETRLQKSADVLQDVQADQLERQLRSYQVRLNGAGELEGRVNIVNPATGAVSTAQDMTVAFLQRGTVILEVHPGIEGRFQVAVQPGVYSVVGAGPDGYVAYALHVLPAELTVDQREADDVGSVAFQEVQEELAIDSVAVPVSDLPIVMSLARSNIPPELLQPNPSGEGLIPGAEIPRQEYEAEHPINRKDISLAGHQIRIQPDGQLVGRVHRINQNGEPTRIRRMNVFLVQNNEVVAQAPVDELGTFRFFDVSDGIYSFVAAGVEGLAAFTMQAVSGPDLAGVPDELVLPVSFNAGMEGTGASALVDPEDTNEAVERGERTSQGAGEGGGSGGTGEGGEIGGEGEGGGGGGGGGTGGGDGFGGGGGGGEGTTGLGELLGLAALGLAAAALTDDNSSNNGVVSPFTTQN